MYILTFVDTGLGTAHGKARGDVKVLGNELGKSPGLGTELATGLDRPCISVAGFTLFPTLIFASLY